MGRFTLLAVLALSAILVLSGNLCGECFETWEFENKTDATISISSYSVRTSALGDTLPGATYALERCQPCDLAQGKKGSLIDVSCDPDTSGIRKYGIIAYESSTKTVLFNAAYSWEELEAIDWKIVITDMRE